MSKTSAGHMYIPLSDLRGNTVVNIYGIVRFLKKPHKTRGSDYCLVMSLFDQSLSNPDQKLKCLLFAKDISRLPQAEVGDIIRFHRLSIVNYAGELQGQMKPGTSWVTFSPSIGDSPDTIKASSVNYTITDEDKSRVKNLREWVVSKMFSDKKCSLKELCPGLYFDLVCQVVSTCVIEDGLCVLLRVWDGTVPIYPVRVIDTEKEGSRVHSLAELHRRAVGYMYDVCLFDDHFEAGSQIKPGQYVKLCNLHAAKYRNLESRSELSSLPTVELILHRGDSFGRGIVILDEQSEDALKLRRHLADISPEVTSDSLRKFSSADSPNLVSRDIRSPDAVLAQSHGGQVHVSSAIDINQPSTSGIITKQLNDSNVCNVKYINDSKNIRARNESHSDNSDRVRSNEDHVSKRPRSDISEELFSDSRESRRNSDELQPVIQTNTEGSKTEGSVQSLDDTRCMRQTATVILNHPNIKRTKIERILQHIVPYKFRVLAHVVDYHPKPKSVRDFLKLYCPDCHYLCPLSCRKLPDSESADERSMETERGLDLPVGSTFGGIQHYNCPQCVVNSSQNSDSLKTPPILQYIYMLNFLIDDGTDWLMAKLWKNNAVTFFRDISPTDLLQSKNLFQEIQEMLARVCPSDGKKLWIECCIMSYSTAKGTSYQIFDTAIV
ncbi:hypothetical protein CHS0354_000267 [Potamilus streckersoni]|uniref:Protection of telomeres protein 1 n=1 Tax=Potamilus streckersoni TaxID=2493646 RepID=A0AAE0RYN1_9BIVA|nr:hypothetical protein CHS0354_000267 [Potamilus streckersoni]